jgi:hypothetical protein
MRKFKKGDKVHYNSNEHPKVLCTVVDLDFDKGFYFLGTEKHGRLIVDFKDESLMEKVEERNHKFKVGDIVSTIYNETFKSQITGVNEEARVYEVDNKPIEVECIAFKFENQWKKIGQVETHNNEEALIGRYEDLANDYLSEFIKQTGIEEDAPFWVGGEVAGIACVADYFVDYTTIRYVVDGKMSFEDFDEWYCYCYEVKMVDDRLFTPTLEQWCYGEFTRISDERLEEMKKLKKDFEQLVQEEKEKQN